MKRIVCVIALGAAVLGPATLHAAAGIVATVNGANITQEEYDRNLKPYLQRKGLPIDHADKSGKMNQLRRDLLDNLISYELLWQEAQKKKYVIDDAEVNREYERIMKENFPSKEEFLQYLKVQELTEELFKVTIRRGRSIQNLVDKDVASAVTVSDGEVHDFYAANVDKFKVPEQVKARHILVQVDSKADQAAKDEAKKKAEGLLKQVKEGADFAKVAESSSDCPSKANGGDLGFFGREQMVKPFADAAFGMKPGEISGIVETQFGYHIIKAEERKDAGTVPEAEVADRIRDYLKQGKTEKALRDKVAQLRKEAKIENLAKFE